MKHPREVVTVGSHYYLQGGRRQSGEGLPEPARVVAIVERGSHFQTIAWQRRSQENIYASLILPLPFILLLVYFTVWTQPEDRRIQVCGLWRSDFQPWEEVEVDMMGKSENPCVPASTNLSALPWNICRVQLLLTTSFITVLVQASIFNLRNCISLPSLSLYPALLFIALTIS